MSAGMECIKAGKALVHQAGGEGEEKGKGKGNY